MRSGDRRSDQAFKRRRAIVASEWRKVRRVATERADSPAAFPHHRSRLRAWAASRLAATPLRGVLAGIVTRRAIQAIVRDVVHCLNGVLFTVRVRQRVRHLLRAFHPDQFRRHGVAEPGDEHAQAQQNSQQNLQADHCTTQHYTTKAKDIPIASQADCGTTANDRERAAGVGILKLSKVFVLTLENRA